MSYNLTAMANNTTGLLTFTQEVNANLMGGWFGVLILIGVGIVLVSSFIYVTNDAKKGITASAFIIFGFAFFLRMVSLVGDLTLFVTLVGSAIAIAFTWRE